MKGEEFALFQETQAEAFRMACTFARELAAGRRLTLGEMVRRMPLADPCDDAQTMAFLSEIFDCGTASPGLDDVPRGDGMRPVPVLPSRIELAWLRGMVEDPQASFLLPQALREKLVARLAAVPHPDGACWLDVREMGDDIAAPIYQARLACLAEALRRERFVHYENVDRAGVIHAEEAAPMQLEYDAYQHVWRVIFWIGREGRAIKANVARLAQVAVTDKRTPKSLRQRFEQFLQERLQQAEVFVAPERNAVARAFALFSTYDKEAVYDAEGDRYLLRIRYYAFDADEILAGILSLGAQAVVRAPQELRAAVVARLRAAYRWYQQ